MDIREHSFIRRDQKSGQGGGVGLYIRDGIDFARRPDLENDETESLWMEIRLKNTKPFVFGTIYKPPDSSKHLSKNFNFFLSKTLQSIDSEKRESIIMGDKIFLQTMILSKYLIPQRALLIKPPH